MFLIVGLGNPGKQYEKSRHNVGFMVLDQLAADLSGKKIKWSINAKANAQYLKTEIESQPIELLKPQTFMNNSGAAVAYAAKNHNLDAADIIIIHDDLDLPLGEFKIQKNRGAAGHNGVQSVIDQLGTRDFIRVRIGIASPETAKTGAGFVLAKFSKTEMDVLQKIFDRASEALKSIVAEGLEKTMTNFNQ